MVRDNFKPTLFLNKALNFYPPRVRNRKLLVLRLIFVHVGT